MNWQVISRPEAENDVIEIAAWYNSRSEGLGDRFIEELLDVLDELALNPFLHCRRSAKGPYRKPQISQITQIGSAFTCVNLRLSFLSTAKSLFGFPRG
jgi:hypothetical protein